MKCLLCGLEWKPFGAAGFRHDEGECPLSGITTYWPVVEAINAVIEKAKEKR